MWRFLETLDRRWVFLLVGLTVIVPSLVTIPFPVPVGHSTRSAYEAIEALDEGDFIVLSFSYGPSSMAELQPQAKAILRHAFRKGIRVLLMSLWPDATPLAQEALQSVVNSKEFLDANGESRLRPGVHYVDVGYRQGFNMVILRMAEDIPGFFDTDVRGEKLANLPIMQGVRGFEDVGLVFDLAAGDSVAWWVVFGHQRYGVKIATGVTGVSISQQYPYLNSGQLVGLVGGGVGAAEYERLVGAPGDGMKRVAILSFVHFLIIGLIVLGNVIYFRQRRLGAQGGAA